jgi:hypothetical protein
LLLAVSLFIGGNTNPDTLKGYQNLAMGALFLAVTLAGSWSALRRRR